MASTPIPFRSSPMIGPLTVHVLIGAEDATVEEKQKFLDAFAVCLPPSEVKEIK